MCPSHYSTEQQQQFAAGQQVLVFEPLEDERRQQLCMAGSVHRRPGSSERYKLGSVDRASSCIVQDKFNKHLRRPKYGLVFTWHVATVAAALGQSVFLDRHISVRCVSFQRQICCGNIREFVGHCWGTYAAGVGVCGTDCVPPSFSVFISTSEE